MSTIKEIKFKISGKCKLIVESCSSTHTLSFAPRFKNRAPAKNRDRRAIKVTYTFRPRIESSIDGEDIIVDNGEPYLVRAIHFTNIGTYNSHGST